MIMDAHLLGHFSATTVYDRLRQKYYWKNMFKEIQAYLSNCLPCLRHQNFRIQEHPALAIPITGILDRIQLDLVFGLPETENGNKGILVIMEALTKYPYAIAIKTKSANEIARKFFNFMSVFGPPKEILTDQGREFMNQVLAELINLVGVEHRVTSAYHPRTNGLTERFNQTLINSLKKHTEDNPLNWEDWIPFVLLAYRSRVNTITKFTPYELMFGRKMNGFENWNTPLNQDDEYALYQRSIMLKRLYEHDVPQVLKEVKESQQQQIIRQEKQHHITEESLQPGTKVFLKSLKLQGKLEAKYQGPYIIVKQTKNGNYWLKTTSGKKLQTSYPLSRLKIAAETVNDDDSTFEIEKVLDERIHKGIKEYLVKWKGFTEMENSWVKESNMNAPEAIEEFKIKKPRRWNMELLNQDALLNEIVNLMNVEKWDDHYLMSKYREVSFNNSSIYTTLSQHSGGILTYVKNYIIMHALIILVIIVILCIIFKILMKKYSDSRNQTIIGQPTQITYNIAREEVRVIGNEEVDGIRESQQLKINDPDYELLTKRLLRSKESSNE
jgi:hypothetical protein